MILQIHQLAMSTQIYKDFTMKNTTLETNMQIKYLLTFISKIDDDYELEEDYDLADFDSLPEDIQENFEIEEMYEEFDSQDEMEEWLFEEENYSYAKAVIPSEPDVVIYDVWCD